MNKTGLINNEKADVLYLAIKKEDKSLLIIIAEEANITILISKTTGLIQRIVLSIYRMIAPFL